LPSQAGPAVTFGTHTIAPRWPSFGTGGTRLALLVAVLGTAAGLAAVSSPKLALGAVAGLAFVVIAMRAPAAGLGLFTILAFFSVITEGSNLTIIKLAGFVLVGVVIVRILRTHGQVGDLLRDHPWLAWLAITLGMWSVASMMWALSASTAETNGIRLVEGLVLIFVVYGSVRSVADLRLVLWSFMLGALLAAGYGIIHGSTNPNAVTRLSGGVGDPNQLAACLVPALAFAVALFMTSKRGWEKLAVVGCAAVVTPALFLTQSRGGLVALSVMVVVGILCAGRLRRRALLLATVVAGVGLTYFSVFASAEATARVSSAGDGTGRVDLWSVATKMFENHPLGGIGSGNFPNAAPAYTPGSISLPRFDLILYTPEVTHNTYLQMAAELGSVGLVLFVGLVACALFVAVRALRQLSQKDSEIAWLVRATIVAAAGMFTAYFFFSAQYQKQLWLILGLLAVLPAVTRPFRQVDSGGP
jgi:putative inorganic carbon (hco3(-)) transporter